MCSLKSSFCILSPLGWFFRTVFVISSGSFWASPEFILNVCELSKVICWSDVRVQVLKTRSSRFFCFIVLQFLSWILMDPNVGNLNLESLSDMLKHQFFILHYSLIGFRLKNHSMRVQKRSCFSFKYLILSPQTPDVLLNISSGFMRADVEQRLDQWPQPSGVKPTKPNGNKQNQTCC